MIVTPDIYLNPRMNIGVQHDPRHPFFQALDHHWMTTLPNQLQQIKEEPRDDSDYGDRSGLPLTPPPYQGYGLGPGLGPGSEGAPRDKEGTPPKDTPPASTPSPQGLPGREGSSSNSEGEYYEAGGGGDSLKRLQAVLSRSGMVTEEKLNCPVCQFSCSVRSQFNEHLVSHETKCSMCEFTGETSEKLRDHMKSVHDCDDDGCWGEEELNTPKVNSQGKVKTFRCKQCEFLAVTKLEFWEHSRIHIKQERLLTCPKCPFVTEYKHHLEYHLRNHFGSKPFKCNKCSYSCVNKSMLNSHLKSHSNIYQFRCSDCTYATKYCHSLKLHLRKYSHNPAMVLNPDGSPNPLPIVDVYGTRRGPKQKSKQEQLQPQPQVAQLFNPYRMLPARMPYYNILNGLESFPYPQDIIMEEKNNNVEKEEVREDKAPLDLSCPEPMAIDDNNQEAPVKNRRKGKAFKLDRLALRLQQQGDQFEPTPPLPPPEVQATEVPQTSGDPTKSVEGKSSEVDSEQKPDKTPSDNIIVQEPKVYNCIYCDISFKDIVLYTMHMGYHGYEDPFKCNNCGEQTADKVAFFLHIARTSHS